MVNAPVAIKSGGGKGPFQGERWWEKGTTLYQIYPSSFKDSNGDGIGDLKGIIDKLDHFVKLGVEAIWLCPHFDSPRIDEGYDISNYKAPWAPYGTLEDCEVLIEQAHARGLRVLFDLVVNHCSDKHPWFTEACKSKDSPKRKWFHWAPPRFVDGKRCEPSNWRAAFGGSAWQWDEQTQEYYLHLFTPEQPDLNWSNPELRQAIYDDAVRFWLDRGLDGFRIDTVALYAKDMSYPDVPVVDDDVYQPVFGLFPHYPEIHDYLKEMHEKTWSQYNTMTLGEFGEPNNHGELLDFIGKDRREIDSVILFHIMQLGKETTNGLITAGAWKLSDWKRFTVWVQKLADPALNAHCLTYLESHDQARCVSRFADDSPQHRVASAKMLATYLLTQSGSIIIYEGQEIGMINAPRDWSIEKEYLDVWSINMLQKAKEEAARTGDKGLVERVKAGLRKHARDHSRTPVHWDSSPQAGFTSGDKSWYRVMESYKEGINVADEEKDDNSVLNFYRQMLKTRNEYADSLVRGDFKLKDPDGESTMIYTKQGDKTKATVMLNFTGKEQSVRKGEGKMIFSTLGGKADSLGPYEARLFIA